MRQTIVLIGWLCVLLALLRCVSDPPAVRAAEAQGGKNPQVADGTSTAPLNDIPTPTLGGTQYWTDQFFFHEWRIQRRAGSGEYRLLDSREWQHANGTFDACRAKLEQIKRQRRLAPMHGRAVVLLHGLAAPRWSMRLLGGYLRKHTGCEVFNVEYASTRESIDDHAHSLARVLHSLAGIDEISLVGHSMGNIVIRRYLAGDADPVSGWRPDPRIRRVVMIAPPNHGSITALRWSDKTLFKKVFGKAGRQLGVDWKDLEGRLATPPMEFGIVAGGRGNDRGFSRGVPGDDDGRIAVATTRLAGASDFVVVPMLHELIANDPRVLDYTLHFLQEGCFVSPEKRQPIEREVVVGRTPPTRG
jgi:pimeloyl-ACP methyl ester carboxylesterase